ncbi:MAG TPA: EamA family transporter [Candidatus Sulfotelmatobacter sp.]
MLSSANARRPIPGGQIACYDELVTARKYLVILSIALFGSTGDAFLARGMKQAGIIDIHHLASVFAVILNPFIIVGIALLLAFMYSYMNALSFADLSYVLPATALGYVGMTLLSVFWLHEQVSFRRWAGVASIVIGVGLVAGSPARTETPTEHRTQASLDVP